MTRSLTLAIFLAALCASSLAAQSAAPAQPVADAPTVTATPTFSQSPVQSFPRLSGLTDKTIEALVNRQLANRERNDRAARADCLRAYIEHGKPSYTELIRLTYLSPRFLSIDVRTSYFCGGAYPNNNIPYPLTFDLTTGRELDWHLFFIDSFLNPPADKPSALLQLYLRYAKLDEECTSAVNDRSTTFDFWLDASHKSLIAHPTSLPHSEDACAKLAPIPFTELQTYIRAPQIRQEFLTPAISPLP